MPATVSVVVPVYNERDCIGPLVEEIDQAGKNFPLAEIVIVDDCSDDDTPEVLKALKSKYPKVRVVRHSQRSGQSTGLRTGIANARGQLIVTLDGDGQNNPADIPLLYKEYEKHANQNPRILVAGQRIKRQDNAIRKISSRIANKVRSWMLKDGVRDTGCSLKLFQREDFMGLPFFNHLHRYIPALMLARGVQLTLVDVSHRPRLQGTSKYGLWDRLWVGIADLFGVRWLLSRTKPVIEVTEE
jgi:dolichol-phosphate mannosyltransferase